MENRKFVKFIAAVILLGLFGIAQNAFAYGIETHAALTRNIFYFYNQSFPNRKIPEELKNYLVDGSRHEDSLPRWMNHFYDPVYDRGLESIYGNGYKSKEWAVDKDKQNEPRYKITTAIASILSAIQRRKISAITMETDFTWERAIRFWVNGDKEKALFILGHILHLIEDASVPDHTRNDAHPGFGEDYSPYENYAKNPEVYNYDLLKNLQNKQPIFFSNLEEYFNNIAEYSNNNFYSEGTIGIQTGYEKPEPSAFKLLNGLYYGILRDENGSEYNLVLKKSRRGSLVLSNEFEMTVDDPLIMRDYFRLLSSKAIQHGAGVINLFFQEVEKAKNDPNFVREEKSFIAQAIEAVKDFFSSFTSNSEDVGTVIDEMLLTEEAGKKVKMPEQEIVQKTEQKTEQDRTVQKNSETKTEVAPTTSTTSSNISVQEKKDEAPAKININTASYEALQNITGIGPTLAQRIIDYRNTNGPFYYIEDLKKVSGIGDVTFEKMKNEITVGDIKPPLLLTGGGGSSGGGGSGGGGISSQNQNSGQQETNSQNQNSENTTSESEATNENPNVPNAPLEITDVIFDPKGADDGKERIVIHNPNSVEIDISGYSVQYLSSTAGGDFQKIAKKNFKAGMSIAAGADFIIGVNCHETTPCEGVNMSWSQALGNTGGTVFLVSNQEAITDASDPDVINSFSYNASTADASTAASALYNPEEMVINLSWQPSEDASTSTIYAIYTINSPAVFFATTTATSFAYPIDEVGRDYKFEIRAVDEGGSETAINSAQVTVPSFLDGAYFYRDPRVASGTDYLIDLNWSHYPFIKKSYDDFPDGSWKVMIFYLNQDADKIPLFYSDTQYASEPSDSPIKSYDEWGSAIEHALKIKYPNCIGGSNHTIGTALILSDSPARCSDAFGGIRNSALSFGELEDNHLVISVAPNFFATAPTTTDFITIAFYAFQTPNTQRLIAVDRTKIFFRENPPPHSAPTKPEITELLFNDLTANLSFKWNKSTDPDTLDNLIKYQVNYSTSSEFFDDGWMDVGGKIVEPGNNYLIGLRAIDDFGNISDIATSIWSFPEDFVPLILSDSLQSAYQDFVSTATSSVSSIEIFTGEFSYDGGVTNPFGRPCSIELYEVNDSNLVLIATSNERPGGLECAKAPAEFIFDPPVALEAGKTYRWNFKFNINFKGIFVKFFGTNANTVGGLFSDPSLVNAKFIVRDTAGGIILESP